MLKYLLKCLLVLTLIFIQLSPAPLAIFTQHVEALENESYSEKALENLEDEEKSEDELFVKDEFLELKEEETTEEDLLLQEESEDDLNTEEEEQKDEAFLFPALHITTLDDGVLFVDRNLWVPSTLTLSNAGEAFDFVDVNANMRGRGNSTWNLAPDKRPLRIRFNVAQGMLGSKAVSRDWILLANHFDRSLLRNTAGLSLASNLEGLIWTPVATHFVQLYVNGEYMGVYQLTDEREVSTDRIDLTSHSDPAKSEYFIEMDGHIRTGPSLIEDEDFFTVADEAYDIRYPSNASTQHVAYARDFLRNINTAIVAGDFDTIARYVDIASLVDYYLLNELIKNQDMNSTSVFMQIRGQGDERRLYMGPAWDFDQSSGNTTRWPVVPEMPFADYHPEGMLVSVINVWYCNLIKIPEFRMIAAKRWNEINDNQVADMIAEIDELATTYQKDFDRNFDRHQILGTEMWRNSPSVQHIETFSGQADFLVSWLKTRVEWLDDYFDQLIEEPLDPEPENLTTISVRSHVQDIGWQDWVQASLGMISGTSGEALRMEAINLELDSDFDGSIEYRSHVEEIGWQDWVSDGVLSGTYGQSKRMEAIEIKLKGEIIYHYDIYYRVHAEEFGWMGWARNGQPAGTAGHAFRLEAIEVVLVPKGETSPSITEGSFQDSPYYYDKLFESCRRHRLARVKV